MLTRSRQVRRLPGRAQCAREPQLAWGKATTIFSVVSSRAAGNAEGVASIGSGASMYLSNMTITGNSPDGCAIAAGGFMYTIQNNLITDNNCAANVLSTIPLQ
jgi:hypothetical protein